MINGMIKGSTFYCDQLQVVIITTYFFDLEVGGEGVSIGAHTSTQYHILTHLCTYWHILAHQPLFLTLNSQLGDR